MKNLYLLPTDKISKLVYDTNDNLALTSIKMVQEFSNKKVHIYITSDEVIKKGNWYIADNKLYRASVDHMPELYTYPCKKIILTTDQDLIKDGVQVIDDEFLEWFVKNPSCEFVMTIPDVIGLRDVFQPTGKDLYKIIIPKEEDFELVSIGEETIKLAIPMIQDREEIKQETLEEVVWKLAKQKFEEKCNYKPNLANPQDLLVMSSIQEGILIGAKWQQEQNKNLYSEEEVRKMFSRYNEIISHRDVEEWQPWIDKQFKN